MPRRWILNCGSCRTRLAVIVVGRQADLEPGVRVSVDAASLRLICPDCGAGKLWIAWRTKS